MVGVVAVVGEARQVMDEVVQVEKIFIPGSPVSLQRALCSVENIGDGTSNLQSGRQKCATNRTAWVFGKVPVSANKMGMIGTF